MIKKIFALFATLFLGLSLAACSSADASQTKTFVKEGNGVVSTLTYYYSGDEVSKQSFENVLDLDKLKSAKIDAEKIKSQIKELSKQYQGVKGIEYNLDVTGNKVTEKATVDYKNLDFAKAKQIKGIVLSGEGKKISMKSSEAAILKAGYTEKK